MSDPLTAGLDPEPPRAPIRLSEPARQWAQEVFDNLMACKRAGSEPGPILLRISEILREDMEACRGA